MSRQHRRPKYQQWPGMVVLILGKWCRIHTPPYGIEVIR